MKRYTVLVAAILAGSLVMGCGGGGGETADTPTDADVNTAITDVMGGAEEAAEDAVAAGEEAAGEIGEAMEDAAADDS